MSDAAKLISQEVELTAEVRVIANIKAVINPNGRGYEADNFSKILNGEVLSFVVRAGNADDLAKKVSTFLNTLKD